MSTTQPYGRLKESPVMLSAGLFYEQPPRLNPSVIADRVSKSLPATQLISDPADVPLLFAHTAHTVEYEGGKRVPGQTAALVSGEAVEAVDYSADLRQTWDWPAAASIVQACKPHVVVAELLARRLEPQLRLYLFQTVLHAFVEITRPAAIEWTSSGKFIDPAAYLRACDSADPMDRVAAALNVRMFNIANHGPGEMLMDTRGMAELGLPDVQMHFRSLDPQAVAQRLYTVALYLFQSGDVIGDGHTVEGISPGQKWHCRHEDAMIGPERVVLDIDSGPPFAVGARM